MSFYLARKATSLLNSLEADSNKDSETSSRRRIRIDVKSIRARQAAEAAAAIAALANVATASNSNEEGINEDEAFAYAPVDFLSTQIDDSLLPWWPA